MEITYDEFNELQAQQKIRDYAHAIYHDLIYLNCIASPEHDEKIMTMANKIKLIEDEAVKNIRKMIEGD